MDGPKDRTDDRASARRVLIVDDSVDTARMMKVLLKAEGYETRTAHDGPEAIEAARAGRPDVVLLDLTLPTMGGFEVAETLRSDPRLSDCYIVAVSGHGEGTSRAPSVFDHHLTKPVDHDALIALLARMTGESRTSRPAKASSPAIAAPLPV